jgi:hypothetical protein
MTSHQHRTKAEMRFTVVLLVRIVAVLTAANGASAHHSTAVNFDSSREITITGVLTEATWRNPHSRFRVNVTGADGATREWLVEMGASNTLKRAGFPMEAFAVGDRITVTGWPGYRDRSMLLRETVLQDGRRFQP